MLTATLSLPCGMVTRWPPAATFIANRDLLNVRPSCNSAAV
jgi:hypothetical protein